MKHRTNMRIKDYSRSVYFHDVLSLKTILSLDYRGRDLVFFFENEDTRKKIHISVDKDGEVKYTHGQRKPVDFDSLEV